MIREIFHGIKFVWASVPILVKLSMGRWFVFRDSPDWLVLEWAAMSTEQADGPICDGIKQATEETTRRVTRLISDCYAAKAVGYRVCHLVDDGRAAYVSNDLTDCRFYWRPFTDDGDTLRLAEKLSINIDMGDQCAWKRINGGDTLIQEFWGGDYPSCYRHAIVRAAAQIELAKSRVSAPGAVEGEK